MKKDYSFKEGTYWIYQDSLTGAIDSFVVLSTRNFIEPVGGAREYVEIEADSVYQNGIPGTAAFIYVLRKNVLQVITEREPFKYWRIRLEYPIKDTIDTSVSDYNTAITQLGTYTINGNIYNDVTMIYRTDKDTSFNDRLYISPGIGLIKIELSHTGKVHNWQLIRHKIIN